MGGLKNDDGAFRADGHVAILALKNQRNAAYIQMDGSESGT